MSPNPLVFLSPSLWGPTPIPVAVFHPSAPVR